MVNIAVERESFEHIEEHLRRFKKLTNRSGILTDIKKHSNFTPKSARRKSKSNAARKRMR